jgi:hypothetical protein
VRLRAVGAGNGEGARCCVCGDARGDGWWCISRGEEGGGSEAVGVGAGVHINRLEVHIEG